MDMYLILTLFFPLVIYYVHAASQNDHSSLSGTAPCHFPGPTPFRYLSDRAHFKARPVAPLGNLNSVGGPQRPSRTDLSPPHSSVHPNRDGSHHLPPSCGKSAEFLAGMAPALVSYNNAPTSTSGSGGPVSRRKPPGRGKTYSAEAASASRNGKNRRRSLGEDDDGGDGGDERRGFPPDDRSPRWGVKTEPSKLVCPYYQRDPIRFEKCGRNGGWTNYRRLKYVSRAPRKARRETSSEDMTT